MSVVVSFTGFVPAARFDGLSWTEARIEEGPTAAGPWTQIDVVAITVDADPANPESRDFTTELGTADNLWYRIIFADASGDVTEPTTPLLNAAGAAAGEFGGPCETWVTVDDVLACCDDLSSTTTVVESAAEIASYLLYKLSGEQFSGMCSATVRPCASWSRSCWALTAESCSCRRLSVIRLAGYPVRAITSVTIDDEILDPAEYRLDRNRELVRMADADGNPQTWPSCQRLDIDSGEGTFFVTYVYGQEPPLAGRQAAVELACQLTAACPSGNGDGGDCELPSGVVRVARQGITFDTQQLGLWLLGSLKTGMPMVDAFLAVDGRPRQRRTAIAVPEADPWPLRVS